ncbi:hypothetical protein DM82_1116 [Burkholderia oklahomensis]|uniref:Uncharacterized protein n=1 Tax=Burkholderia oklahomensis TaxID=342113 RepID=A0AAI8FMH1_9BURK|nr:hypothetical protein DM82_1116 [Burkholderia oklahomensis]
MKRMYARFVLWLIRPRSKHIVRNASWTSPH